MLVRNLFKLAASSALLLALGCGGGSSSSTPPPPSTFVLTVNSVNPASGVAITAAPSDTSGVSSGNTALSLTYNAGTSVTLTAPATAGGNNFSSWTGCTSTSAQACTVTVSANTTVTANYTAPVTYTLTVNSTNPATGVAVAAAPADNAGKTSGTTSFPLTYNAGTSVTLTAPATSGANHFTSWTGCTSTSAQNCTVSLSANTTVTANYAAPVPYTLTVASTNPATGVAISASPADNTGLTSGKTQFTLAYNSGTTVTLTAPATEGANSFSSWSGCTSTSAQTCVVAIAANTTVTASYAAPQPYTLTIDSSNPATGVAVSVAPPDNAGNTTGVTPLTLNYNPGTVVTLSAPVKTGTNTFAAWSGCAPGATTSTTVSCSLTMSSNLKATAGYNTNSITSITVTPSTAPLTIGSTLQFTAAVSGIGTFDRSVIWSIAGPTGYKGSAGTITNSTPTSASSGLYTTPYPAPPTVTVTATSTFDPTKTATATITLSQQAAAAGPALSVDAGSITHAINPLIYGMNDYTLDPTIPALISLPIERWGGDATTRYNYLVDADNSAADYFFESFPGKTTGYPDVSQFNTQVEQDQKTKTATLATVPMIGWTTNRSTACSYSVTKYGKQKQTDPYRPDCGLGVLVDGTAIVNDPKDTSSPADETFVGGWAKFLVGKFGTAAKGGIGLYALDNEPEYWDAVHKDVHPVALSYDELTTKSLAYSKAIKDQDPTAQISGPVISNWMDYFYSRKDVESGYSTGPCYCQNGNPVDRLAHGDIPFIEYYLQQFAASEKSTGVRLLDYVDLHTYFAAPNAAFNTAGDTTLQQARLNSTRVFWDPTYTDPAYTDPNNRTSSQQPYPPQLINLMKGWVAKDYPGTKLAITEYNWGGQEAINGAIAQADILGIFGREGLDLGTLWGPPDPVKQVPGLVAFELFRNYDGAGAQFGDMALTSTSAAQGQLSVYGAQRTADGAITILVLNKGYADLTSTLSLPNLTATGPARTFLYSSANLAAIVAKPDQPLTPPGGGTTVNTLSSTFPAQSITLLVIPTK